MHWRNSPIRPVPSPAFYSIIWSIYTAVKTYIPWLYAWKYPAGLHKACLIHLMCLTEAVWTGLPLQRPILSLQPILFHCSHIYCSVPCRDRPDTQVRAYLLPPVCTVEYWAPAKPRKADPAVGISKLKTSTIKKDDERKHTEEQQAKAKASGPGYRSREGLRQADIEYTAGDSFNAHHPAD